MCGIAGVLRRDGTPADPVSLERAADAIAHRGPDDSGIHVDGPAGLAHRRLSIVDLSAAGHEPMPNENETVWLTYNGEIYNSPELRRELESAGHTFFSDCDAEVLVHGFEEWGEQMLGRLNGIFAFAIWDSRERTLFMSRDRFGIKPLYVSETPERLVFASEVKAILAYDDERARLSLPALNEYLTFQNIFGEATLFDGVTMLPAGTWLKAGPDGTRRRQWFDPVPAFDDDVDPDALAAELGEAVQRAVDRQLMSDVPVGGYLSGGMDSASLVTLAGRSIPHIHTFTGGFDMAEASPLEVGIDERADAEMVAREVNTEHYETVLHAGAMARVLPKLVYHLEDLRAGTSYQNFHVANLASRFVKVVLAGTGGDELFAGYPWRYSVLDDVTDRAGFNDAYYSYWTRLVPDDEKQEAFTADAWAEVADMRPRDSLEKVTEHLPEGLDPIDMALYFEQRTFLHGLLVVEDKLSMAHSMEARVPLLDNEVVDLSLRIPGAVKNTSPEGKALLRQAATAFLPGALVHKKKQGFTTPDRAWYAGRSLGYIQEILLDGRSASRGVLRQEYTERMLLEHVEGVRDHRLVIWSLLCLEWWHRLFVDGERP
ncbi:MAG: asparagine synthase (glutamine-hydrolyzing) [Thermoleophilaceae bacterium]|nr:asparagine synthase (glutamine-hydrolyzing) [Thermoleophilaceae bacterium]